tara:strand:+ start:894 stop:1424 length:531 start_codon:yes stop_codon:yes gene_type:complete
MRLVQQSFRHKAGKKYVILKYIPEGDTATASNTARQYADLGCAYCPSSVRACRRGESKKYSPRFYRTNVDQDGINSAYVNYADPFTREVAHASAKVKAEGYCGLTRVEEICEFAKKLGYTKIGIAICISFVDLASTLSGILGSHGFSVASVACNRGGVAKECIGLADVEKIKPGGH